MTRIPAGAEIRSITYSLVSSRIDDTNPVTLIDDARYEPGGLFM
jgi:hypothetical protein